jgi:hypothetical protein
MCGKIERRVVARECCWECGVRVIKCTWVGGSGLVRGLGDV